MHVDGSPLSCGLVGRSALAADGLQRLAVVDRLRRGAEADRSQGGLRAASCGVVARKIAATPTAQADPASLLRGLVSGHFP